MIFEIALLVASSVAGLAAITVSSINYVKNLEDKEDQENRDQEKNDLMRFPTPNYELRICPFLQ